MLYFARFIPKLNTYTYKCNKNTDRKNEILKKLHFFKLTLYNAKEIKYNGHITNYKLKYQKTMKEVTYYEND